MDTFGKLPLSNVRAVVLTQAWAGAFATQLLADMGAEVIQIEALNRPDPWRGGYPPRLSGTYPNGDPGERPYDRNAAFNSVNTNKLGITLDLNYPESIETLLDLVSISDVMAENFSGRVIPNFGLEYPRLRAVNPSIVMLRMPTYGCTGPYSNYMGNGGTTEPMSGISSMLGYADSLPMNSGIMHTDPVAGLMVVSALLMALHYRRRTGLGQMIDLSQQETTVGLIAGQVMDYTMNGRVAGKAANRDARMAPHGNYPCEGEDSWVAIAVRTDDEWVRLCDVMGTPEFASDSRFSQAPRRVCHADELDGIVSRWTSQRQAYAVMETLQNQGIPCAPVLKAHELPDNPQLKAREFFETIDHPDTGPYLHAGTPWRLSRAPGRPLVPAPTLGQHSREVLERHLGLSEREIQSMVDRGITGDTPDLDD